MVGDAQEGFRPKESDALTDAWKHQAHQDRGLLRWQRASTCGDQDDGEGRSVRDVKRGWNAIQQFFVGAGSHNWQETKSLCISQIVQLASQRSGNRRSSLATSNSALHSSEELSRPGGTTKRGMTDCMSSTGSRRVSNQVLVPPGEARPSGFSLVNTAVTSVRVSMHEGSDSSSSSSGDTVESDDPRSSDDDQIAPTLPATDARGKDILSRLPRNVKGHLMSIGSIGHGTGDCNPCVFFTAKVGCRSGLSCICCHFRHPRKRRNMIRQSQYGGACRADAFHKLVKKSPEGVITHIERPAPALTHEGLVVGALADRRHRHAMARRCDQETKISNIAYPLESSAIAGLSTRVSL